MWLAGNKSPGAWVSLAVAKPRSSDGSINTGSQVCDYERRLFGRHDTSVEKIDGLGDEAYRHDGGYAICVTTGTLGFDVQCVNINKDPFAAVVDLARDAVSRLHAYN
jgi:hypothetical protein